MTETKSLAVVNKQIAQELADPNIVKALLATTFPNFTPELMKQAIFEGLIRGFTFKNFLQKDLYAIKYAGSYSLVTSIDLARKIGMRSGVIGKSAPTFEMDGKKPIACTITIKRRVGKDVAEFTDTVYFDEYTTGKNLWASKPLTMLAKVCEMHVLRMACPEEMAKMYTEEEFDKEKEGDYDRSEVADDVEVISTGDDMRGLEAGTDSGSRVGSKEEFWEEPEVQEEINGGKKK